MKNTIPGSDMAGKIERVAKNVKLLQPGDDPVKQSKKDLKGDKK